ncbi:hypothetical protein C0033_24655 [Clostridium sp. chh4-2]|nr:hypothetical protein C0033_24655 [Clostridium sp. chh4-2]
MLSCFTLNVKAFSVKTSPFTLNPQGISENSFTVDVKNYSIHQIFLSLASQATAGKKGKPRRAAEVISEMGSYGTP